MEPERRSNPGTLSIEHRGPGGGNIISGYAAVFYDPEIEGSQFELYRGLVERIDPNAFNRALEEQHDVRGLVNHDPGQLLGRVSSGTLTLSVDDGGLRYTIDVPDTQAGRDTVTSIQRGDLDGSSFAFHVRDDSIDPDPDTPGQDIRTIRDLNLVDVGPVPFPAYQATTTGARSELIRSGEMDELRRRHAAIKLERRKRQLAVRVRLRSLELNR